MAHYLSFSIHETKLAISKYFKEQVLQYRHLENMLILLVQYEIKKNNNTNVKDYSIYNLLLNYMIMKTVLSSNLGSENTKDNIATVNNYYHNHPDKNISHIFSQAKALTTNELNAHNAAMIVRRLSGQFQRFFTEIKKGNKKAKLPKTKSLNKVYNYALPLDTGKYSFKKNNHLGITLGKKIRSTYLGKHHYIKDKIKLIQSVTISLLHGHIYYNITYLSNLEQIRPNNKCKKENNTINPNNKEVVYAGIDIGLKNLLSLFILDNNKNNSLIISGKPIINYNVHYNKKFSQLNTNLSKEIIKTNTNNEIEDNNNEMIKEVKKELSYSEEGMKLLYKREQLHIRRRSYMNDYMQKLSKKIVCYLKRYNVTHLVLSKNLSFAKCKGSIELYKGNQKFYQIPFGRLLNLLEEKSKRSGIVVEFIDEAYTSKTSSISSDVKQVQQERMKYKKYTNYRKIEVKKISNINRLMISRENKEKVILTDLSGNRGVILKDIKTNKAYQNRLTKDNELKPIVSRGLFKDKLYNILLNADLNGACNHIKLALDTKTILTTDYIKHNIMKWCNPIKIKSNSEFDKLLLVK